MLFSVNPIKVVNLFSAEVMTVLPGHVIDEMMSLGKACSPQQTTKMMFISIRHRLYCQIKCQKSGIFSSQLM